MIEIEPATTADAEEIVDAWISLASDQRRHGSRLRAEANRDRVREEIARAIVFDSAFVARVTDGSIVGFVTCELATGSYIEDETRGVISNLFVKDGHRNEGTGTALLDRAEQALQSAGPTVVTIEVLWENHDARRFYKRAGYDPHRVELTKRFESNNNS